MRTITKIKRMRRDYKKLTDNITKITKILPDIDIFIKSDMIPSLEGK